MKKYLLLLLAICLMVPAISSHSEAASKGKILVVASSENRMSLKDGSLMDVGFFLNELAVPTQYLADHGYDIVLADVASGGRFQRDDRQVLNEIYGVFSRRFIAAKEFLVIRARVHRRKLAARRREDDINASGHVFFAPITHRLDNG